MTPVQEEEELEAQRRLARFQSIQKREVDDGKPKRDEWMIVPPKSEDWASKVDPTKIKSRKFQTGKGAKAPQKSGGDSTLWTETPDEKRRRLADEVMGRVTPATQGPPSKESHNTAESQATARRIQEYNVRAQPTQRLPFLILHATMLTRFTGKTPEQDTVRGAQRPGPL